MFGIFAPRYIKEAKQYRQALSRAIHYKCDVLPKQDLEKLLELKENLNAAIRGRNRTACAALQQEIEAALGRAVPPQRFAGLRENIEVFLVAFVIAAGVRAYILQPFRIPTGSMQPTLQGIVGQPTDTAPPNILRRVFDFVWLGRSHFNLRANQDVTVKDLVERTHLNFFTFTDIFTDKGTYSVFAPAATLQNYFGLARGRTYRTGDAMVVGYVDTGDQLFVDKVSYHFTRPTRGEVFVFKTIGIPAIQRSLPLGIDSQHYIKRLAGVPGDELRIASPKLFVNGEEAAEAGFQRVMSLQDGYRGYANFPNGSLYLATPEATFRLSPGKYFALGDNSYNSSDSRMWGTVREEDLAGRGFVVYWPFSKRWGLVK